MRKFKNINNPNLGIMTECPICKSKGVDLNVIEENNDGYLLHSKCRKCENAIVMVAVNDEMGMNVIGMNTDLSMDELIKLKSCGKPVEINEVIEFHNKPSDNFIKELMGII